jgi:Tfp pilus assembly protein PilX
MHQSKPGNPAVTQQQGATLIMTMVILLILSLLATTAMNTAFMDERMAANAHYQNRAYHLTLNELEGQYALIEDDRTALTDAQNTNSEVQLTPTVADNGATTAANVTYLSTVNLPESSLGVFQAHRFEINANSQVAVINASSDQSVGLSLAVPATP